MNNAVKFGIGAVLLAPIVSSWVFGTNVPGSGYVWDNLGEYCLKSSMEAGRTEAAATHYCDCSISGVREQNLGPIDMLDKELMTELVGGCSEEAGWG